MLAVVSAGCLGACQQPPREKTAPEKAPDVTVQAGEFAEVSTGSRERYIHGIDATPDVRSAVESLEALSPQGSSIAAAVPDELSATVTKLLSDERVPFDNKIYLLTVYQEKAMWVPPDFLRMIVTGAAAVELMPELDYSIAQLLRNELKLVPEKLRAGELSSEQASALSRELADPMVGFFRAAYEERKIETLYVMGLLGAYYDRMVGLAGGRKPKDRSVLEDLSAEGKQELLTQLDLHGSPRTLVGPPWLLYCDFWGGTPPQAVGRRLVWGSWSTSAAQTLLALFRQVLAEGDWQASFDMLQKIRTLPSETVPTIESVEYVDMLVTALVRNLGLAPLTSDERKLARQMRADFEEFDAVWVRQREEELEKRNRLLAAGDFKEARRAVDMYTREAMTMYNDFIDRVEDVIRPHSAEQARKEREKEEKTRHQGHWRKVTPGSGSASG